MKRITQSSTIVDDLMPGTEYVFRVVAGNQIGSSEPSEDSNPSQMPRSPLDTEFSLDPFDGHYDLEEQIGKYVYSYFTMCILMSQTLFISLHLEVAMVTCTSVCTRRHSKCMPLNSSPLRWVVTTPSTS